MTKSDRRSDIGKALLHCTPDLSMAAQEVLRDLYLGKTLHGTETKEPVAIDSVTRISIEQGAQLHHLMRAYKARTSLEIGFAYGFSTIWMLDALGAQPGSSHMAIDPHQRGPWKGIGLHQTARLGKAPPDFVWIEDLSMVALPRLLAEGRKFDFVFVDGNHRFDDILVDFYYSDCLLPVGGLIAFDDMWMESVRAVADFIRRNRQYREIEQPVENLVVFRKLGDDDRPWHHYRRFRTAFAPVHPLHSRLPRWVRSTEPYRASRALAGRLWRRFFPRR